MLKQLVGEPHGGFLQVTVVAGDLFSSHGMCREDLGSLAALLGVSSLLVDIYGEVRSILRDRTLVDFGLGSGWPRDTTVFLLGQLYGCLWFGLGVLQQEHIVFFAFEVSAHFWFTVAT
jgi:hypothetical protein